MRAPIGVASLFLVLMLQSGCAVLTKSQREEAAAFARAAASYGTLPGEPIRVYGEATRFSRLLEISTRDFRAESAARNGWREIGNALAVEKRFQATAAQADAALDVLARYAKLLKLLTSDEFTAAFNTSAKELGAAVDKGTADYNNTFRVPNGQKALAPAGATIAAVVRGAGGIYLRSRQSKMLRAAVTNSNPIIVGLAGDIASLMRTQMKPFLTNLNERLSDEFETAAKKAERLPLATIEAVATNVQQIQTGQSLADAAAKAADRLAAGHTKLQAELTSRQTLSQRIEEIQALADEIQAAQKLRKELNQ